MINYHSIIKYIQILYINNFIHLFTYKVQTLGLINRSHVYHFCTSESVCVHMCMCVKSLLYTHRHMQMVV